jgi:pimeloyl-ACP methyl ester carboxylesterase
MTLNYLKSGEGRPLIFLHGLFGMLDNWKSIGKAFEKYFTVYLVDQRNHGKSPHSAEHSYKLLSADLAAFLQQQDIDTACILGHSMGGKTAMQFAFDYPQMTEKLIVVDMGIKRYAPGHDTIFDALFSVNLNDIHYRIDAEKILYEKIPDFNTRQFILKNLARGADGTYAWKFNLHSLFANYETEILAPVNYNQSFSKPVVFLRGENSGYITDADFNTLLKPFPEAKLITIKGAGHWVHADKPAAFIHEVQQFLHTS